MKNIDVIKINKSATIKQALKIISDGGLKIAIVVDENDKLLGTLSDGDIRRGLLKGLNVNSSIKSIIFTDPVVTTKKESKDKLLKKAISKKVYQIPVVDKNKKVVGMHILDGPIISKSKPNLVVIMAGGKGKRLRPLTNNTPKPMLKIGKKPILQTIIEKFKENKFKKFLICVNFNSKIIKNYFGNGKRFGVEISYIEEKKRMGTAGALSLLKKKPKKPFFVINGDILINLDFQKMLDFHNQHNSKATMGIKEYIIQSPYGEIKLINENITSIKEKPKHKFFVNAGVYILDPKCIDVIPKKSYDMHQVFKKIIATKKKTISFPLEEYWLDIGRPNDFDKASIEYDTIFNKQIK